MLILSRRFGETLMIEHGIKVHVLDISGSQVRFGIDAPGAEKYPSSDLKYLGAVMILSVPANLILVAANHSKQAYHRKA